MLKTLKRGALHAARAAGAFRLVGDTAWRRSRLLILCYHGISLEDEHLWNPPMYMRPRLFEERLRLLRRERCNVLPLGEAVERLYGGTLPPRSVAITFDDGAYDFYEQAFPLLQRYGMPATVYLTTYYSENNLPVFGPFCSYILWRRLGRVFRNPGLPGLDEVVDLRTLAGHTRAILSAMHHADDRGLSGEEKQAYARALAGMLELDFDALCARRFLHIMNADEVREVVRGGIDVELHTHRHRTPLERDLFQREMDDNRVRLRALTGREPRHFCYPSGVNRPEFVRWLEQDGVRSATICDGGIATSRANPLLLPRLVDHESLSPVEFAGWVTGVSALLPRKTNFVHDVHRSGRPVLPRVPVAT